MAVDAKELAQRFPRFTEHMNEQEVASFAHVLERRTYLTKHVLMRVGAHNDTLYLVRTGVLGVWLKSGGHRLDLATLQSGAWVGEMGFIDPGPAAAAVDVRDDCELWSISHEQMDELRRTDLGCLSVLLEAINGQLADRLLRSQSGVIRLDEKGVAHLVHPENHLRTFFEREAAR